MTISDTMYSGCFTENMRQAWEVHYHSPHMANRKQIRLFRNTANPIYQHQLQSCWCKGFAGMLTAVFQKVSLVVYDFLRLTQRELICLFQRYRNSRLILRPMVAEIPVKQTIIRTKPEKVNHGSYEKKRKLSLHSYIRVCHVAKLIVVICVLIIN